MRLADLDPRWLLLHGARVGFVFRSPIHPDKAKYQTCFFMAMDRQQQHRFQEPISRAYGVSWADVQYCEPTCAWACTPRPESATWENISVTPSLDGNRGGNWHGFITNGAIVGGV